MSTPEGQGDRNTGRLRAIWQLSARGLAPVAYLLTTFVFTVSDALARGGSGSHSFSGGGGGGGGGGGSSHSHFFNNGSSGGGGGSGGGAVIVIIVVVVIIAVVTYFVWKSRSSSRGTA